MFVVKYRNWDPALSSAIIQAGKFLRNSRVMNCKGSFHYYGVNMGMSLDPFTKTFFLEDRWFGQGARNITTIQSAVKAAVGIVLQFQGNEIVGYDIVDEAKFTEFVAKPLRAKEYAGFLDLSASEPTPLSLRPS